MQIQDPFIQKVNEALDTHKIHTLRVNAQKEIVKVPFFTWLLRVIRPKSAGKDIQKICALFTEKIAPLQFSSIHEAVNDPLMVTAKKLFHIQKKLCPQEEEPIRTFTKTFYAKRVNLPVEALEHNPGFLAFLKKYKIYMGFAFYGGQLRYDKENHKLYFPSRNGEIDFEQVLHLTEDTRKNAQNPDLQSFPCFVGPDGIQDADRYKWSSLRPVLKLDPSLWDGTYRIEICTCCKDKPRTFGDHSWIRLYTPNGDVYSIGQYRYNGKGNTLEQSKAYLQCPDVSEQWDFDEIQTMGWKINEMQFLKVKNFLESVQKGIWSNENPIPYDPIENNCTAFSLSVLDVAEVEHGIKAAKPIWYVWLPTRVQQFIDSIEHPAAITALKVVEAIANFGVNVLQCILGANSIRNNAADPHRLAPNHPRRFESRTDLASSAKACITHPIYVAQQSRNTPSANNFLRKGFLPANNLIASQTCCKGL